MEEKTLKTLLDALKRASKPKTSAYDTTATVTRVEGGTAWVHIPGGVRETPVKLTINARAGDAVQVRVSGGRAFLVGNATAPPTDDSTATKAIRQVSVVKKVVEAVKEVAETASRIASNTNQYFWRTETGTDTGVHITEIPQEEFLADPTNGGGNLLARSNGVAVRDGLEEVASFGGDESVIGKTGDAQTHMYSGGLYGTNQDGSETFRIRTGSAGQGYITETSEPYTDLSDDIVYTPQSTPIALCSMIFGVIFMLENGRQIRFDDVVAYTYNPSDMQILNQPFGYSASGIRISAGVTVAYFSTTCTLSNVDDSQSSVKIASAKFVATYKSTTGYPASYTFGTRMGSLGAYSLTAGSINEASGDNSTAFGEGTSAAKANQTALGRYNEEMSSAYLFVIGNGTDDGNRSNALAVGADGSLLLADGTVLTLAKLKKIANL